MEFKTIYGGVKRVKNAKKRNIGKTKSIFVPSVKGFGIIKSSNGTNKPPE